MDKNPKNEEYWMKKLTPEQYKIMREKGTEPAWSGDFVKNNKKGKYKCSACGQELFDSKTKFESSSGWPSFWEAVSENSIIFKDDLSGGKKRIEVKCGRCDSHLGHVFDDGPEPSGKRYCINSLALDFKEESETS